MNNKVISLGRLLLGAVAALLLGSSCSGCVATLTGLALRVSNMDKATYGDSIVSERPFAGAQDIDASTAIRLRVYQSDTPRLVVVAPSAERAERLVSEVSDGRLTLTEEGLEKLDAKRDGIFLIEVYTPDIRRIGVHGASQLELPEGLKSDSLVLYVSGSSSGHLAGHIDAGQVVLEASGASQLHLEGLFAGTVRAEASGASRITAAGRTDSLGVGCSGASTADLVDLHAQRAEMRCSGASSGKLRVIEQLSFDLSGASHLSYYGQPRLLRSKTSGASSISQLTD